jgi:hypothetical protein
VLQTIEGCAAAYQSAAFFLIVHPEDLGRTKNDNVPASIWQLPEMRKPVIDSAAMTLTMFQCIYNAPMSKPTRFVPTSLQRQPLQTTQALCAWSWL